MRGGLRSFAKELAPPAARRALVRASAPVLARLAPRHPWAHYEYVADTWPEAAGRKPARGWNVPSVAAAEARRWESWVRAVQEPAPLGVAHEVDLADAVYADSPDAHHTVMAFAYVLARAAHETPRLSVLDWGGGIGHYAALSKALMPGLALDYNCADLPEMTARGRQLLRDVTFHDDERCLHRRYGLVVASGSLQYVPDWADQLARLGRAADPYLYVARLPVVTESHSYVVLERAYSARYETEYLGWFISRTEMLGAIERSGLELVREFLSHERARAIGRREEAQLRGFLLRRAGGQ